MAESCSHHPTATALPAWHRDWPWELRPEVNSAATKVLVVTAVWAAPVEGELFRAVAENSLLVLAFSGFLCVFGKYVLEVFCKKKNHLSNLNSVNKQGVHMLLTSCRRAP